MKRHTINCGRIWTRRTLLLGLLFISLCMLILSGCSTTSQKLQNLVRYMNVSEPIPRSVTFEEHQPREVFSAVLSLLADKKRILILSKNEDPYVLSWTNHDINFRPLRTKPNKRSFEECISGNKGFHIGSVNCSLRCKESPQGTNVYIHCLLRTPPWNEKMISNGHYENLLIADIQEALNETKSKKQF